MWSFNATLDRDVPCASVGRCFLRKPDGSEEPVDSAARSKECTGTIPAGQAHYHEHAGRKPEFTVTLVSAGKNPIDVILALRKGFGLSLKDAKSFVDRVPKLLRSSASKNDARDIEQAIGAAGGTVDLESDEDTHRFCRHCVREMNDRRIDDGPLLVRVELTYSDGLVRSLEGDAADEWERQVNNQAVVSWAHGQVHGPLPWASKVVRRGA